MRLYEGKIPTIARDTVKALIQEEVLDVEPQNEIEFERDVEAVLREYVRTERQLMNKAKDIVAAQGGGGNVYRIKRRLAKERNFEIGDDAIEYIVTQMIETFFHSTFVEEVYAEDNDLRKLLGPILKKHTMAQEETLDQEVRSKIKNLEEGSKTWDIEYQKVMERMKTKKNME